MCEFQEEIKQRNSNFLKCHFNEQTEMPTYCSQTFPKSHILFKIQYTFYHQTLPHVSMRDSTFILTFKSLKTNSFIHASYSGIFRWHKKTLPEKFQLRGQHYGIILFEVCMWGEVI